MNDIKRDPKSGFKIKNIQDLKDVVEYLKPHYVRKIVIDGVEIEFDTTAALMAREQAMAPAIDDEALAKENLKLGLKGLLEEQEADERWST